jgi:hypothetical protein
MLIAILAGMSGAMAHETLLGTWGNISAIVGAVVALGIVLFQFWHWLRGDDFNRALRVNEATITNGPYGADHISLSFGIHLRNESNTPLSRTFRSFNVTWKDAPPVTMRGGNADGDLSARQTKLWQDLPFTVARTDFPATFTLDYVIDYGRLGKKLRMRLTGQKIVDSTTFRGLGKSDPMVEGAPETYSRISRKDRSVKESRDLMG